MSQLPIWKSFQEGAFDLKVEYEQQRRQEPTNLKIGDKPKGDGVKTGIKIK
jgi:hypothetical protein